MSNCLVLCLVILGITACVQGYHGPGGTFYWKIRAEGTHGVCAFNGFKPGGGKVSITKIKAPVAELENKLLGTLFNRGSRFFLAGRATAAAAKEIKVIADIAKNLGKVAAVMGVIGQAFGVLSDIASNNVQDVVNAVNKALEKLTQEINDKLEDMKGYVDQQVLDLEMRLYTREYKTEWSSFARCASFRKEKDQIVCLRDTERNSFKKFAKFAIHYDKVTKHQYLSINELKSLELNAPMFRNYAVLRILTLKALMTVYEDEDKAEYKYYAGVLRRDIDRFSLYADKAFVMTKLGHISGSSCQETVQCPPNFRDEIGYQKWDCSCKLDRMMATNTERCRTTVCARDGMRFKGGDSYKMIQQYDFAAIRLGAIQYDTGDEKLDVTGIHNGQVAAKKALVYLLRGQQAAYKQRMAQTIDEYWTATVLSLIPQWKKIKDSLRNV